MTRMLPTAVTAVAMATLAAAAGPVHAADAGDWIVRGGLTYISPEEGTSNRHGELGPALAGTDVNVGSQAGFGGTLTYMVDDNIGFELLVGTPFKHDLALAGGALDGAELGSIKHLPPALSVIYEFDTGTAFNPYAGVGLNYTFFFDEKASDQARTLGIRSLDLDDSFGLAAQIGADYEITNNVLINASVRYMRIQSTADVRTATGRTNVDVDINPVVYTVAMGYRF